MSKLITYGFIINDYRGLITDFQVRISESDEPPHILPIKGGFVCTFFFDTNGRLQY